MVALLLSCVVSFQNGAELIYLPNTRDIWTGESGNRKLFTAGTNFSGLLFKSDEVFEPKEHFGCKQPHKYHSALYSLCSFTTPAIQAPASVVLDRHSTSDTFRGQLHTRDCDPRAPPITLPSDTFVPFVPQNALLTKEAFWALLFLSDERLKDHSVWTLVVQKLLWLTGNKLLIHSVGEKMTRSSNTEDVRPTLDQWKCSQPNLVLCILQLVRLTTEKHKLGEESLRPILIDWLQALTQVGYEMPHVKYSSNEKCISTNIIFHPVVHSQTVHEQTTGKPLTPISNVHEIKQTYQDTCQPSTGRTSDNINFTNPWTQFEDVLLILVYNRPHYESIPYVETLYRPFFPYILHCGPGLPSFYNSARLEHFRFSFYSYPPTLPGHMKGAYNYECVISAMEMNFPVKGYLLLADDVLMSLSKISQFQRNHTWFIPERELLMGDLDKGKQCFNGQCNFTYTWLQFKQYGPRLFHLLHEMKNAESSSLEYHCYEQLTRLNGGQYRSSGGYADFYYLPERIVPKFTRLAKLFLERGIFLEITIANIIRCLEDASDIDLLVGNAIWTALREQPWLSFTKEKFYDKSYAYLHPTKWSSLLTNHTMNKDFFCSNVLPYLHDKHNVFFLQRLPRHTKKTERH